MENGQTVILDGSTGQVFLSPDEATLKEYTAKREEYLAEKAALQAFVGKQSVTADGHVVELCANIGKPEDALKVVECDGEGVGLFGTEFLFMIVRRFRQKMSSLKHIRRLLRLCPANR